MTFSLFRWDNCVLCVLVLLPFSLAAVYDCMNEEDVCVPFEDCTDGLLLKNGSLPCGQCDLCIQYLGEGETCSKEFFFTPSSICGPFLTCQEVDVEGSRDACVLMNTTCVNIRTHYIQATFGNGSVVTPEEEADFTGMPRYLAECQDDGKFAPKQCIRDGMCYCVDEDGNRLPGEINTERLSSEANCQCARDWSRLNKLFPKSQAHPLYCSLDGNYREANCAHDEACFCMNPDSLESEGSTVTRRFFDLLPCYDSDVLPSTYPFMERCERLQQQLLENSLEGLPPDTPVIGVQLPTCWPDGKFAPVQKDDEHSKCVKPDGFQIGNYSVPLTDPTAAWQNCFCARAEWLAKEVYEDLPIPDCCPNGNYKNWTCTEKTDGNVTCSCIDSRTGQPLYSAQPTIEELECYVQDLDPCTGLIVTTTLPPTTMSETTLPATTMSETTLPATTMSETTQAATTMSETTLPPTTMSETTLPATTMSETTLPPTTMSETTLSPSTV